jgi:hypothetical protein
MTSQEITLLNGPTCEFRAGHDRPRDVARRYAASPREPARVSQSDWPSLPERVTSLPERLASLYDTKEAKESHCYAARARVPHFRSEAVSSAWTEKLCRPVVVSRWVHRGLPEHREWFRSDRRCRVKTPTRNHNRASSSASMRRGERLRAVHVGLA